MFYKRVVCDVFNDEHHWWYRCDITDLPPPLLSDSTARLFVGNLPSTFTQEDLDSFLRQVVPGVVSAVLKTPLNANFASQQRGYVPRYAFVDFSTESECERAISYVCHP